MLPFHRNDRLIKGKTQNLRIYLRRSNFLTFTNLFGGLWSGQKKNFLHKYMCEQIMRERQMHKRKMGDKKMHGRKMHEWKMRKRKLSLTL